MRASGPHAAGRPTCGRAARWLFSRALVGVARLADGQLADAQWGRRSPVEATRKPAGDPRRCHSRDPDPQPGRPDAVHVALGVGSARCRTPGGCCRRRIIGRNLRHPRGRCRIPVSVGFGKVWRPACPLRGTRVSRWLTPNGWRSLTMTTSGRRTSSLASWRHCTSTRKRGGRSSAPWWWTTRCGSCVTRSTQRFGALDQLLKNNCVPAGGSGVLVSTDLLREVGGFDLQFSSLADWDLWIRLALAAPATSFATRWSPTEYTPVAWPTTSVGWRMNLRKSPRGTPPRSRAGLIGAAASVALGTVANDSGATFLTIGTIALTACLAFTWAQRPT